MARICSRRYREANAGIGRRVTGQIVCWIAKKTGSVQDTGGERSYADKVELCAGLDDLSPKGIGTCVPSEAGSRGVGLRDQEPGAAGENRKVWAAV